jgi:hypothetical protein
VERGALTRLESVTSDRTDSLVLAARVGPWCGVLLALSGAAGKTCADPLCGGAMNTDHEHPFQLGRGAC